VAQWLLQVKPDINISADNEYAFRWACCNGHLPVAQWLLQVKPDINISADRNNAFCQACCNGHLAVVQWLLQVDPNINISDYDFRQACTYGHLNVAQLLLQVKPTIDIRSNQDDAFCNACTYGHLEVAQWLLQVNPAIDIRANNDWVFRGACRYGHLEVAEWLESLAPDQYEITDVDFRMNNITCTITASLPKHSAVMPLNRIDNCPICDNTPSNLQTPCGHQFCEPCLQQWLSANGNKLCPCCRNDLSSTTTTFQPIAERK
jgi:ankyrin repeat protein